MRSKECAALNWKVTGGMSAKKMLLHKLESGGPGITTVEDLATEYFDKVGPNVRRLADLVGERRRLGPSQRGCAVLCVRASTDSLTEMNTAHKDLRKTAKGNTT